MGNAHALSSQLDDTNKLIASYAPVRIMEIELAEALPTLYALNEQSHERYQRVRCVVRLHSQLLGLVELDFAEERLEPEQYAQHIWHKLYQQINDHLRSDDQPIASELHPKGLPWSTPAACIIAREQFLTHAPFVSVIVGTHERAKQLSSCLSSLLALRYPSYEIIIVDNAPRTTNTFEVVRQAQQNASHLHYRREDRQGLSWARNSGILAAKGEIVVFTDDDVVVDQYWLVEMVRAFSSVENVGCVTGIVLPLELETPAQFWFEEFGGFTCSFQSRIIDLEKHHPRTALFPYALGNCGVGASMAFLAPVIRGIGGFDPHMGGSGSAPKTEDIDVFFRTIKAGYTLVYTPSALLYHQHRRDIASLRKQIYNYGVGCTAYLTNILCGNPLTALDLATQIPRGLFRILSSNSEKNKGKSGNYPKDLTRIELKGMIYGPFAYLQTRWMMRNVGKWLS